MEEGMDGGREKGIEEGSERRRKKGMVEGEGMGGIERGRK